MLTYKNTEGLSCIMNFLSHFYLEQDAGPYRVVGSVLPDLVKNGVSLSNLHPQRHAENFKLPQEQALLLGWQRHIYSDAVFHNHPFFFKHTQELKASLKPLLQDTLVRPSFLAHISLELLIDYILISKNRVDVNHFYHALGEIDEDILLGFLEKSGMKPRAQFLNYYKGFLSSRYLFSYQQLDNISYALNRICLRLWPQALDEKHRARLSPLLQAHLGVIAQEYPQVFREIQEKLSTKPSQ